MSDENEDTKCPGTWLDAFGMMERAERDNPDFIKQYRDDMDGFFAKYLIPPTLKDDDGETLEA